MLNDGPKFSVQSVALFFAPMPANTAGLAFHQKLTERSEKERADALTPTLLRSFKIYGRARLGTEYRVRKLPDVGIFEMLDQNIAELLADILEVVGH